MSAWLAVALKIRASDRCDNAREVRSSGMVGERQGGAAAGVPTLSGRNRSRKSPENIQLFRYVVHESLETNSKQTVFQKNEN